MDHGGLNGPWRRVISQWYLPMDVSHVVEHGKHTLLLLNVIESMRCASMACYANITSVESTPIKQHIQSIFVHKKSGEKGLNNLTETMLII